MAHLFAWLVEHCASMCKKGRLITLYCWWIVDTSLKCQGTIRRLLRSSSLVYLSVNEVPDKTSTAMFSKFQTRLYRPNRQSVGKGEWFPPVWWSSSLRYVTWVGFDPLPCGLFVLRKDLADDIETSPCVKNRYVDIASVTGFQLGYVPCRLVLERVLLL